MAFGKTVEENFLGHLCYFPERLGYEIRRVNQVTVVNCSTKEFNVAFGVGSEDDIQIVIEAFQNKPFTWWVSTQCEAFTSILSRKNFVLQKKECVMICDLSKYEVSELEELSKISKRQQSTLQNPILQIHRVSDEVFMEDFLNVLGEHDPTACNFYRSNKEELMECREEWLYEPYEERLYVGYINGEPVVIGTLAHNYENNSAGIFSLLSKSGSDLDVVNDMIRCFMYWAKLNRHEFVTLSVPSEQASRYTQLGFIQTDEEIGSYERIGST